MLGGFGGGFGSGNLQNSYPTYGYPIMDLDKLLSGQNDYHVSHNNVMYKEMAVSGNGLCRFWPSNDDAMGGVFVPFLLPSGSDDQETATRFLDGVLLDSAMPEDHNEMIKEMAIAKMSKSGRNQKTKRGSRAALIKGQWTDEEDRKLIKLVKEYGTRKWAKIAENLVGRVGKQCRERWHNHLRPDIKKDRWNEEEERILVEAHEKVGNRWSEIAKLIDGRSENTIKNHWNATKRRQHSLSRRKHRQQSSQTAAANTPRSSILQDYIRSKLNIEQDSIHQARSEDVAPTQLISNAYDHDELLFMQNLLASNNNNNSRNNINNGENETKDRVMNNGGSDEEVSGVLTTNFYSDLYLSDLLNGSSCSTKKSMGLGFEDSELANYCSSAVTDSGNKEMDLMEMVSSSQASNYNSSSSRSLFQ